MYLPIQLLSVTGQELAATGKMVNLYALLEIVVHHSTTLGYNAEELQDNHLLLLLNSLYQIQASPISMTSVMSMETI
jgi:hypothetical protein